jgi:hypothetical protein
VCFKSWNDDVAGSFCEVRQSSKPRRWPFLNSSKFGEEKVSSVPSPLNG